MMKKRSALFSSVSLVLAAASLVLTAGSVYAVDPLFDAPINYGAGDNPLSVFSADLDGDNDNDLAVANLYSDNVSILLNNGDGTFLDAVNYGAGNGPYSVFSADLDGDNDNDLAVANANSDNVSILLNNGDGTFAAPVNYGAGDAPISVFSADLDGDGDYDLAVANYYSENVSILLNNGDGTFAAPVNYGVGDGPRSVFSADLDGDSDNDLAVANWGDNVSILLNNGDGTFQAAVNYGAGSFPMSVFSADLDGDNDNDLAVANWGSNNVSILLNNGDGTFAAAVNYGVGDGPMSVFSTDLDGDNDNDLAVANRWPNNVSILLNNGDGTFAAAVNYGAAWGPRSVFSADLDGDGDYDLAVANSVSDNVSILINLSNTEPPPGDLVITDIMPIQVIEDCDTLVVGKPTVVKVNVHSTFQNPVYVSFKVTYNHGQDEAFEYGPGSYGVELQTGGNWVYLPGGPSSTHGEPWDFGGELLWASAGVDDLLSVEVDWDDRISETDEANNVFTHDQLVVLMTKDSYKIMYQSWKLTGPECWFMDPGVEADECQQTALKNSYFLKNTYPLNPNSVQYAVNSIPMGTYLCHRGLGVWEDLAFLSAAGFIAGVDRVVGIVSGSYFSYHLLGGYAGLYATGITGAVMIEEGYWVAAAHEIHHSYDNWRCGDQEEYLVNYPGNPAEGFWVIEHDIIDSYLWLEGGLCFMGAGGDQTHTFKRTGLDAWRDYWVCDECYRHLLEVFEATEPGKDTRSERILFVSGRIDKDDSVILGNMFILDNRSACIPYPGAYALQFVDSLGGLIQETEFDVTFWLTVDYIGKVESDTAMFAFSVPYPNSVRAQPAAVNMTHNDVIIAQRDISANAPSVTVLYPNGGEELVVGQSYAVTWSGTDLDADTLSYCALFRSDSTAEWTPLLIDFPDTAFLWETADLAEGDNYRIKIIATDGVNTTMDESDSTFRLAVYVSVDEIEGAMLPDGFKLSQNYPNPFNCQTQFEFSVPQASHVTVEVLNILGQQVTTLVDRRLAAGSYRVTWDGRNAIGQEVSSGVYLYRLTVDEFAQSRKMLLLK